MCQLLTKLKKPKIKNENFIIYMKIITLSKAKIDKLINQTIDKFIKIFLIHESWAYYGANGLRIIMIKKQWLHGCENHHIGAFRKKTNFN